MYDADAMLKGELVCWVGARLGRAHCPFCDITHGLIRERAGWRECRDGLPARFDTYHRDDQPVAIRVAAGSVTPVVAAETDHC